MQQADARVPASASQAVATGATADTPELPVSHPTLATSVAARDREQIHATPGFYVRSWRRLRRNRVAMTALTGLFLICVFVLAAPLISRLTGFTPYENHLREKLSAPGTNGYLLGSDGNGRDILTRLAYGGQVSLQIAVLSAFTTLLVGSAVGLTSGYLRGKVDLVLMRLVDVLLAIPTLPLLILIASLYRPGPLGLAFVLAAVSWMGIARIVRGEVLSLREREYVEAARVVGSSQARIAIRHIFPNVAPLMVVFASLAIPDLILSEAALSFLGFGVQVPTPSWGNMLGEAQAFFRMNVGNIIIPGAMIYLTSLCLFLLGSGLRDAFDPKMGD